MRLDHRERYQCAVERVASSAICEAATNASATSTERREVGATEKPASNAGGRVARIAGMDSYWQAPES